MEEIRMNIKNNKNCKITINDEEITVSEKEKTADEMFEELGYSILDGIENFYTNVLIAGKKQKDISFDDIAKDFITIYLTKYNEYGNLETNQIVLSVKELQAINKKCKELRLDMIETETGKVLNKLAREQFKSKLLAEILMDLQVCKLENLNPKEYIEELKQEIDNIYERFNNKNE